jgi:SAM-dependent methyltransferase
MMLNNIDRYSQKPALYSPGNALMWTDDHISKELLRLHLNEDIDLGSRKPGTIKKTVDWILSHATKEKLNILDLGCGPGLYAKMLAQKGHKVTGVDFSENSISYARQAASESKLDITYIHEDYTKLDLPPGQFDLALLVFTDFGPLLPEARQQLLTIIKKVLKPGGLFVFDVLNDQDIESKLSPKNWEIGKRGFWSNKPYLALSQSFFYNEEKVILYQHIVFDEEENIKLYRFWHHFYSNSDLAAILKEFDFKNISFHRGVIPSGDGYDSSDVTFCIATA